MKKTLMVMLVAAMAHTANATTYVYDSTVANWFGSGGWTHVVSDPGGSNPLFSYNDATSIHAWNNYGVLTFNNGYVGAEWTAPAGEVITNIEFSFWGIIGTNSAPNLTVYAGENSADTFVNAYALPSAWASSSASASLDESLGYRAVAIRSWDYQDQTCGFYAGWQSQVSSVTITTVPEPASVVLLASGAIAWMRRRK